MNYFALSRLCYRAVVMAAIPLFGLACSTGNNHPQGEEEWTVAKVRESTRAAFAQKLGEEKAAKLDLSYITEDLLRAYKKAKHKDAELCKNMRAEGKAAGQSWCYYGNHVVFTNNNKTATWTNSNPDSTCDRPTDECYAGYSWTSDISVWHDDSGSCPPNTQGYNSTCFSANP